MTVAPSGSLLLCFHMNGISPGCVCIWECVPLMVLLSPRFCLCASLSASVSPTLCDSHPFASGLCELVPLYLGACVSLPLPPAQHRTPHQPCPLRDSSLHVHRDPLLCRWLHLKYLPQCAVQMLNVFLLNEQLSVCGTNCKGGMKAPQPWEGWWGLSQRQLGTENGKGEEEFLSQPSQTL